MRLAENGASQIWRNEVETIKIGAGNGPEVSSMACGLWRIHTMDFQKAKEFVSYAMEQGINYFDNAAIYGSGEAELQFGRLLESDKSIRNRIVLQTKCGNLISKDGMRYYDFSKKEIISSVECSLRRMKTDYLDILLLHRPDALCEPEEVAEAFAELKDSGKVRWFGVSNQNPMQIELLKKYLTVPLLINQLQFGLAHAEMAVRNMYANTSAFTRNNFDDGVLDYCRVNGITVQAWSPLQHGDSAGTFLNNPDFPVINKALREMGSKYAVEPSAVAIAWILRHPAKIIPVLGSISNSYFILL
mgnify:CR=1 FL=1